ncbi:MAG: tRNA (N(6)-L-threonylcarbamoyladenosine(37)-C(2))-methylthiotransferase MtaB [Clostridia bacterium]|nr:tRNA (N(6)-L-threonylcarbamoyladenosine(37)-C(2))-methylthiotransferase MtaB [Clostridia bacterium]
MNYFRDTFGRAPTVGILTLGCKVNQYESEAIAEECKKSGITVSSPDFSCDFYVVNSCSVTAEADRKSCQMIRRLKKLNPLSVMIVTGCSAQRESGRIAKIDGVDYIVGNAAKMKCAEIIADIAENGTVHRNSPEIIIPSVDSAAFERMKITAYPRTRQVIKIEDGCENRCAYCAIPDGRGTVRSKAPADVLEEVLEFCRNGCREIVLTGIETASYGRDTGDRLDDLLVMLDRECGEFGVRFRLGSVSPLLFTEEFVSRVSSLKSAAHHFHISMQSGSDSVLAGMRRHYTSSEAGEALKRVRKAMPDVMFTTDIIVGFPGETDADFAETAAFILEHKFLYTHIFPYSRRDGTPAATMPRQVAEEVKKKRAATLADVAAMSRTSAVNGFIASGSPIEVLIETYKDGKLYGHSGNFLDAVADGDPSLRGQVLRLDPVRYEDGVVICKMHKEQ